MKFHQMLKIVPAVAVLCGLLTPAALAYPPKIHIMMANEIRDNLRKNWDETGIPAIELIGPEGTQGRLVQIPERYAEAIWNHPEYFRAGAVGPDNTVFPGLTDPSHAWTFDPFGQCLSLLQAAETPEELAYGLGCYVHGVGDNAVHHVVNYFTGQTFTLYPIDAAEDGELQFSLLNVLRHMSVEGQLMDAVAEARPEAFTPDKMRHAIPAALVRRVFCEDNDQAHGLWHWLAGRLVARKNEALMAAQLDGFDPSEHLALSIEDIKASGETVQLDKRVIQAYVQFLRDGGAVTGFRTGGLAPGDYLLLLPEIVSDLRRFMALAEAHGRASLEAFEAEWEDSWECPALCPILAAKIKMYSHLFLPTEDGGPSPFQQAIARKNAELDQIFISYVTSVERMSNLVVEKGFGNLTREDILYAVGPLHAALDAVVAFPYEELFPGWLNEILADVEWVRGLLEEMQKMLVDELKQLIVATVEDYLVLLSEGLREIRAAVEEMIGVRLDDIRHALSELIGEAKLRALGLDISTAREAFGTFTGSVLYMNSYNASAAVLSNHETVSPDVVGGIYSGPVSYDASYQLAYNQLALCSDLRQMFFPCGISAAEMLQPNYLACESLEGVAVPEPPVECHLFDETAYADPGKLSPEVCHHRPFEEILSPRYGHVGSYTLAFPPEYASPPPACVNPAIYGINADIGDTKADDGRGDLARGPEEAGVGCSTGGPSDRAGLLALPVLFLLVVRRRGGRR